jgi:hypothetical protein
VKARAPKSKFAEWNQAAWRRQACGQKIFRLQFSEKQQYCLASRLGKRAYRERHDT